MRQIQFRLGVCGVPQDLHKLYLSGIYPKEKGNGREGMHSLSEIQNTLLVELQPNLFQNAEMRLLSIQSGGVTN